MEQITQAQIIEKAKELGKMLKDSDVVKEFIAAKTAYEQDKEVQELLGQFNLHKMSIGMLSKQDNPDETRIAEHEDKMRMCYDKIMETQVLVDFQTKSQAVEKIIGDINSIFNLYISGDSPSGCTGSCSTCSGCSSK